MIVMIPLGGIGDRFKKYGYNEPKPLINVIGKPIISWLFDNLILKDIKKIIIPYNRELEKYRFEDFLTSKYGHLTQFVFQKLEYDTEGPVETIIEGLRFLEKNNEVDCPILSLDCDNFYYENIINLWNGNNSVILFEDQNDTTCYSYVKIEKKLNIESITDIAEKDKISHYACTGAYGFKSWKLLKLYSEIIIKNNIKQKNEYYVSAVIKEMINKGEIFIPHIIDKNKYVCLGTPLHVRIFSNEIIKNHEIMKGIRVCFDLDNTLVTFPKKIGDYKSVEPIQKNIDILKRLKDYGCTIIIHTARRMKTCNGNIGKVLQNVGQITFDTLCKFNIPYDEIYFGKPNADFYVDDLAVSCFEDIEKKIGLYKSEIAPRKFNSIVDTTLKLIRKCSENLSGEIYYYNNIPKEVIDVFPLMVKYDKEKFRWYEIERIDGIPINKLYLEEQLSGEIIKSITDVFNRLHQCSSDTILLGNIYENYTEKIKKRYEHYDYSKFDTNNNYYLSLLKQLDEYEKNNRAITTIIHGDAVMTNILIDNNKKIKMIDMRGKLGNINSLYGDQLYDWAKFYQSLIGYDEILEEKTLTSGYKNELIKYFEKIFIEIFGERLCDLKLITSSLLFSLIPLHDNIKCQQYYNLGKRILPGCI
jgi:capsule biosynthesis phosphatase